MSRLPPCCGSCPELDGRRCKLLADLEPASRDRLGRMPCDAKRLLRARFRGYADDVAGAAQARWESAAVDGATLRGALPTGPLDARLWLGSFPFVALAESALPAATSAPSGALAGALPASNEPLHRALGALSRISPTDTALVIEGLRGDLDAAAWRTALGIGDAPFALRVALAVYRVLALRFEVVGRIASSAHREALVARRFSPGDGGELDSLAGLRDAMGDPTLSMATLRSWYRTGAEASLRILEADAQVSPVLTVDARRTIERALRLDGPRSSRPPEEPAGDLQYAEPLFMLLSRDGVGPLARGADGHLAPRALASLADAEALDPSEGTRLAEHLLACRDGRCNAVLRAEVTGREACRLALSLPMSDPPPGAAVQPAAAGAWSPHMIKCRDVLWETFSSMADAEGRSVDDLVEEAMDGYRQLRSRVGDEAGRRPTPSSPPEGRGTGLRLGTSAGSRPPAAPSPSTPPIPRPSDSEEATIPRAPQGDPEDEEKTTPRS